MSSDSRAPSFLYIGPAKGGSTWIYHALQDHPEVYIPPAKGLFFFDQNYDRGYEWYLNHFKDGTGPDTARGEISHFYLYSPEACERVHEKLPEAKIFVCLRNPIERTISAYQFMRRNERFKGSLEEALEAHPNILSRSCYAPHLRRWLEKFPRDQVGIFFFDDLKQDASGFAKALYAFIGVDASHEYAKANERVLPASRARFPGFGIMLKNGAVLAKKWGAYNLVGRVKASPIVKSLYKPLKSGEKFRPTDDQLQALKEHFRPDIEDLTKITGRDLSSWL